MTLQVLFLLGQEAYFTAGEVCGPEEATALHLLQTSVPLDEDMLTRLCLMGLLPQLPLSQPDALSVVERVVERAAASHNPVALQVTNAALIEAIMKLSQCSVQLPEPPEEEGSSPPPLLALRSLYWRAVAVVTILAARNFDTLGKAVWEDGVLPTVKHLMEVLLTHSRTFPLNDSEEAVAKAQACKQAQAVQDCEAQEALEEVLIYSNPETQETIRGVLHEVFYLDMTAPALEPPEPVLSYVLKMDAEVGLGMALRAVPQLLVEVAEQVEMATN